MQDALSAREQKGMLRTLRVQDPAAADFSSNDYLGVARRGSLAQVPLADPVGSGATGSRLLSGHSEQAERLELTAAEFHRAPAALLFNSGYDANVGFFSCVPEKHDVVVYDSLIHASVHDGMRLGRASENLRPFAHNSLSSLRETLNTIRDSFMKQRARRERSVVSISVIVVVESVYSMDGDVAPLAAFLQLADGISTESVSMSLVVDEAHGVGISGPNGEGVVVAQGVTDHPRLLARIVTYGKAFGAHGAMVLGSKVLRSYLVNYARPLIYSTALPPHSVSVLSVAYQYMMTDDAAAARKTLTKRRNLFRALAAKHLPSGALLDAGSESPIQGVLTPGNRECVAVSRMLRNDGLDVYPIRTPTVPKGTERIRVIIHAHNTENEVRRLVDALAHAIRVVCPGGHDDCKRKAHL
jgi:8-amino-7-oxononanoate synthase